MSIEHLVYSVLPYVWLTLGLVANVYLFITLKQELRAQGNRIKRRQTDLEQTAGKLGAKVERACAQNAEPEPLVAHALVPSVSSGMNLTKRSQALRMLRRGERRERVATTLQMSQSEVELLYKVQGILAQGVRDSASKPGGTGSLTA